MKNEICAKIRNFYFSNRIAIWMIISVFFVFIGWISSSVADVPIMDFWRYINDLTPKVFKGEFSVKDMWSNGSGHREGFAYLLIALNIRYFKLNLTLWIYMGAVITLITGFLIYRYYIKNMDKYYYKNDKMSQILFLVILLSLFSFNQWEIYTLPFALSFAIRRLLYLISFVLMEHIILNYDYMKKYQFEIIVLLFFIMLLISGGYLPAFVGSIVFAFILDIILNYKKRKKIPKQYVLITISFIIGIFIYTWGLSGIPEHIENSNMVNMNLIKGIFIMLGSSVIDTYFGDKFGTDFIMYIGIIIFTIYIFALIIYFFQQMWKKTYVPIMMMAYSGINIIIIYFARASKFDISYLSSSRYSCETIMGIIGVCYILIHYIQSNKMKIKKNGKTLIISLSSLIIILTFLLSSYIAEFKMSKYRKNYQDNLIEMLYNIDEYSDDELEIFQANNPQQVRDGVKLMKRYSLGVFKNINNE